MNSAGWLEQSFVFLAAATLSVPIAKRLGLGSVLGYLIAGAVIGPFGLGLLGEPKELMHVAEFGVVIMLFLIGLEIRPSSLWRMRRSILGLGGLQLFGTAALVTSIGMALGLDWKMALAIGLILAQSSTAIVLQTMQERGLASAIPGRAAFSILLFQDLSVIPTLAIMPLLSAGAVATEVGHAPSPLADLPDWLQVLAVPAAVFAVVGAGRYATRPLFRAIANSGLREIFTAAALALVAGVALLMQTVGLSAALGAFVAGVVLADSEYRHELESDIDPFRGLLLGLFFITVGAGLDFALLMANPLMVLALTLGLLAVKALVLFGAAKLLRYTTADAVVVATALAQGGEFAFVLFGLAVGSGVIGAELSALLTAAVALSMALTPLMFILGNRLAERQEAPPPPANAADIENVSPHAIIAGYGRFGQVVGRLLRANGYRVSVLDHSADHVEMIRGFGITANYGDASRVDLLEASGAATAEVLVVAVDDQDKAIEIVEVAKANFPHLKTLVRAFDRRHVYELMRLAPDHIVRETFASAVELGVEALHKLGQRAYQARRAGEIFARYDRLLVADMARFWGDPSLYRSELIARTDENARVMQRDLAAFRQGDVDRGWETDDSGLPPAGPKVRPEELGREGAEEGAA